MLVRNAPSLSVQRPVMHVAMCRMIFLNVKTQQSRIQPARAAAARAEEEKQSSHSTCSTSRSISRDSCCCDSAESLRWWQCPAGCSVEGRVWKMGSEPVLPGHCAARPARWPAGVGNTARRQMFSTNVRRIV